MSSEYPAEGTFSLAQLLKVRDRARAAFTPFTDFDAPSNVPSADSHRLRLITTYRDEARLPEIGRALRLRFLTK
jgi:hypothetical protein